MHHTVEATAAAGRWKNPAIATSQTKYGMAMSALSGSE